MNWNKWGIGLLLWAIWQWHLPTTLAQALRLEAIATDPTGTLVVFYPEAWTLTQQAEGFRLQASQTKWTLSSQVTTQALPPFEQLPDWLVDEGMIPSRANFSVEDYRGWDAWVGQGQSIRQNGVYSAWVAVPIGVEQLILLQLEFPREDLSQASALFTTMLNQMVILPVRVSAASSPAQVNLPLDWVYSIGESAWLISPSQTDWERLIINAVPDQLGILATLVPDISSTPDFIVLDEQSITVNGARGTIQLRRNEVAGITEVVLLRQVGPQLYWQVSARALNSQYLLEQTDWIKAIFASLQVITPPSEE